jgi:hypothetical protein
MERKYGNENVIVYKCIAIVWITRNNSVAFAFIVFIIIIIISSSGTA